MGDQLVSVRMPVTLVKELKELVHVNHYLDVSEELRSIIRKQASEYLDPYQSSINDLRQKLSKDLKEKNKEVRKEELLRELKVLLEVQQ